MPERLRRELGVFGAVMLGLGSIVGTGVFVSLGVAAGVAGPAVLLAIVIGAAVASFNGLSSAQLAADHPVSGGTYEYGYRYLRPWLGFLAGVTFLLAKSASAATAALGFAGYLLGLVGAPARWSVPLGVATLRDQWQDQGLVVVGITSDTSHEMDEIKQVIDAIDGKLGFTRKRRNGGGTTETSAHV